MYLCGSTSEFESKSTIFRIEFSGFLNKNLEYLLDILLKGLQGLTFRKEIEDLPVLFL